MAPGDIQPHKSALFHSTHLEHNWGRVQRETEQGSGEGAPKTSQMMSS